MTFNHEYKAFREFLNESFNTYMIPESSKGLGASYDNTNSAVSSIEILISAEDLCEIFFKLFKMEPGSSSAMANFKSSIRDLKNSEKVMHVRLLLNIKLFHILRIPDEISAELANNSVLVQNYIKRKYKDDRIYIDNSDASDYYLKNQLLNL